MFCTNCGTTISDDAQFCPYCGADLEEVIDTIKKAAGPGDILSSKSDFKLSLEEGTDTVFAVAYTSKEINIIVQNTSLNSILAVENQLSGPLYGEITSGYKYYDVIESGQKVSAHFIVIPKYTGTYTLTTTLKSGAGHSLTFPFYMRVKTTQESRIPTTRSKPPGTVNYAIVILAIMVLVGLILLIGGIVSLIRGGLPFNSGITMIIIGFIFIAVGTKGQCCWVPCACACDDCDGDCDC
ncbi:MAG: zinc-ribbon domain-containing protein [Candidatus Thorarchaeota archaeon]